MTVSTEVRLVRRPDGPVGDADCAVEEVRLRSPGAGEVKVVNLFNSVDPYMRGRMTGQRTYIDGFALGETMTGESVGEVTVSNSPDLSPGDLVVHHKGWRTHAVLEAAQCRQVTRLATIAPSAYLGVLGMPGLTAYVGLLDVASFQPGDTVFVSAASGAVGSLVGQLAKLRGAATVVGSAGSAAKAEHLVSEYLFDEAFDYHDGPVAKQLSAALPEGIDVYFDNVGGEQLQAAFGSMRPGGRIALCGAIAEYNATTSGALENLSLAISRRIALRGFIVYDHEHRRPAFERDVSQLLLDGKLRNTETVFSGIESSVAAFQSLFTGDKIGKVVVRVG